MVFLLFSNCQVDVKGVNHVLLVWLFGIIWELLKITLKMMSLFHTHAQIE
jgi:hypothetical protein